MGFSSEVNQGVGDVLISMSDRMCRRVRFTVTKKVFGQTYTSLDISILGYISVTKTFSMSAELYKFCLHLSTNHGDLMTSLE